MNVLTMTSIQEVDILSQQFKANPLFTPPGITHRTLFFDPTENLVVQGVRIQRGEMTLGVIGSANRDESVFEKPDMLDLTRDPNRHLSFGQGIHFCLGAPLARMEAQIAINTLLRRMPDMKLKGSSDSLRWSRSLILRGLEALPITF